MKWNPKIFLRGTAFALLLILPPALAAGEELSERENTGLELQVELNRLGSSGDPLERETLLRRLINECQGTESAEAACWSLSDLYLNAFASPEVKKAREVLEFFLKQYPDSRWTTQVKCRLLDLYSVKIGSAPQGDSQRASQIRRELLADKGLPQLMKGFLKEGAGSLPRLVLPQAPKKTLQKTVPSKKGSTPRKSTPIRKKTTKRTTKKGVTRKKR
ncbi:MAG: hypothetical protein K6E38_02070 [Fretibacterium sp.]|nr:hypothetical protein [Fretibacterium sp.]